MKARTLAPVGIAIAVIGIGMVATHPYQEARLTGFLHPEQRHRAAPGFQAKQATIAVGSGGIFGVGLGESVQKASYLPEAHTDMIAAVIGEELGLAGMVVLIGLFGMFGYAGLRAAHRARDRYSKLLAAGLTSLILAQAALNLFAVLGLAPLTGVPLPFVSLRRDEPGDDARRRRADPERRPPARSRERRGTKRLAQLAQRRQTPHGRGALRDCAWSRAERTPGGSAQPMARVVIAAGGTAGHVVPAIAVADALRAEGAEVSFLGTRERAEAELVPAAGYEIDFLRVSGLDRRNPLKAAVAAGRAAARGARGRAGVLSERDADVVMGGGGYVAGPGGACGRATGPAARPDRGRQPPGPRQPDARPPRAAGLPRLPDPGPRRRAATWSPGGPCPRPCSRPTATVARRRFGIPEPADCVTIVGGSLGARSINLAAFDAFTRLERRLPHDHVGQPWILHVAGRRDYAELRRRWHEQGSPERYALIAVRAEPRRRPRRGRPGPRTRRRFGDGDRGGGTAGDPRSLSACDRRPPDRPTPAGWPTAARPW